MRLLFAQLTFQPGTITTARPTSIKLIQPPGSQFICYVEHYVDIRRVSISAGLELFNRAFELCLRTPGPQMSRARYLHTCNVVTHVDGTRDIVIIGGDGPGRNCPYGDKVVDIIHLHGNSQAHHQGNIDSSQLKLVNYPCALQ